MILDLLRGGLAHINSRQAITVPRPDLALQPLPSLAGALIPLTPAPPRAALRQHPPASTPSRQPTSARFTSGNASHRGTPHSGAANWGAPLHLPTPRPTSLTSASPRLPQPPEVAAKASRPSIPMRGAFRPQIYLCMQSGLLLECGFGRLKHFRAVATRYDKLAVRYEATVHIAAINEWLPRHFMKQALAAGCRSRMSHCVPPVVGNGV